VRRVTRGSRPRYSLGCSRRWPIGSPIWQPRVVPISCSTLAAGRDLEADVADADRGVPRFLEREWPAVDGAAGQHRVGQEAPSTYKGRCEASRWRDDNSRKTSELSVTTAPLATFGSPEAPTVYRSGVPPDCAANCAVIVTAHDASGDTGQNCDRGILSGNCEFWPVSSERDGIRFGLANRRLQPLGHLTRGLVSIRSASTCGSCKIFWVSASSRCCRFENPPPCR
jgi:hypothetical protein